MRQLVLSAGLLLRAAWAAAELLARLLEFFLAQRAVAISVGPHQPLGHPFRQFVFAQLAVAVLVQTLEHLSGVAPTAGSGTGRAGAGLLGPLLAHVGQFFFRHRAVAVGVRTHQPLGGELGQLLLRQLAVAVLVVTLKHLVHGGQTGRRQPAAADSFLRASANSSFVSVPSALASACIRNCAIRSGSSSLVSLPSPFLSIRWNICSGSNAPGPPRPPGPPAPAASFLKLSSNSALVIVPSPSASACFKRSARSAGSSSTSSLPSAFLSSC